MNTKTIILTGLVVIVLLAVGGGFLFMGKNPTSNTKPNETKKVAKENGGTIFSSIKDALSKSLSLTCDFTDEAGRVTKSYIKNGAVRANFSGKTPLESGSVIVKDKKMYLWTADKKGFTMELTDEQLSGKAATDSGTTPNAAAQQSNILASLEKYKNNCKAGVISDSMFVPPTDITFSDLSQLMKAIPTMPKEIPGANGQNLSPEQLKEMMKQFAPSGVPQQ